MAFTMRQPFKLTSALAGASKTAFRSAPVRSFHSSRPAANFFTSRTTAPSSSLVKARNAFRQSRTYMQQPVAAPNNSNLVQKLVVGGAIFGGTFLAIQFVFNRETREDGGMPPYERAYLNDTFMHTGLGVGIIGLSARAMFQSGMMYRMMATNPWVVMIGGLAVSIGTMMGTRAVDPDNYVPKYALWTAFNATQGMLLAPLLFMAPPALIARAGLYTVAMMGSISFVGATAKQEKYLYLGGPLLAGAALVAVSGFAPLILPATAVRTLAFTENIWLYGGLAVFGGFTLYDVQKVLAHARMAERGLIRKDAVNESISLELDFLNIFIRMVQILMMQQNRRK
ncbi:related to growth hormone inducible transmembrane protein [Phialocephala subalpina]|uniref:Related to growth hormone inducible transmembrane protein n=1 Tax=Phialocephala subalpina TaxID=576137 RepID=A0A1L7WRM4_9HELO|nr:related to growth hormone inducible transmembrane protein [Phialocephala subalpina]